MASEYHDLFQALRDRVERTPESEALVYIEGQQRRSLTYGQLLGEALVIASSIHERCKEGDRVLMVYPPGLAFISALFGCFAAGVVAVPAPPPNPHRMARSLPRLLSIVSSSTPTMGLCVHSFRSGLRAMQSDASAMYALPWLATDDAVAEAPVLESFGALQKSREDRIAVLQYTSGSTADPKGVVLTHESLFSNIAYFDMGWDHDSESVIVSWLPAFHDLGLVYGVLTPLLLGVKGVLMSPAEVIQYPESWLRTMSAVGGTHSGGPNFIYDLCVRRVSPAARQGLELSRWRMALSAAEPVRPDTLRRFHATFQDVGFRWEAFCPGYGLSEATCKVAAAPVGEPPVFASVDKEALERHEVICVAPSSPGAYLLAGCGKPGGLARVVIVDPETRRRVPPGRVGEIWVAGGGLGKGYWGQPDASKRDFQASLEDTGETGFLRTGDLGFLLSGELFVTGRLKDLIIIRGVNYYPQDIEFSVTAAHPALRQGCCAAFSIDGGDTEALAVVVEAERRYHDRRRDHHEPPVEKRSGLERRQEAVLPSSEVLTRPMDGVEVRASIRAAVSVDHGLSVAVIALIAAGTIPKTSSGKIQRRACRSLYLDGKLELIT